MTWLWVALALALGFRVGSAWRYARIVRGLGELAIENPQAIEDYLAAIKRGAHGRRLMRDLERAADRQADVAHLQ